MKMRRWIGTILAAAILLLVACGQSAEAKWQEQYDLGMRYLSEGNYEEAIIAFTAAIDIDPKRAEAFLGRGDAYVGSSETADNLAAALADYEAALELDETLTGGWLGLADVYIRQGDYDKALEILQEALEKAGDTQDIQNRLDELQTADTAEYEVERQDLSYYDQEGRTLIALYYDLVRLTGDRASFEAINQAIVQDYRRVFPLLGGRSEYESYLQDPYLSPEYPYRNTLDAQVTHNGDGVFSICMTQSWYMGGVSNVDHYGMTFDLSTGEAAQLPQMLGQDEAAVTEQLKTITKTYMTQNQAGWFDEAWETVDGYTLEDFPFYIQEGQVMLCFPTYALAPGASGSITVPTGLMLNGQENG